jgi:hypothetical protein
LAAGISGTIGANRSLRVNAIGAVTFLKLSKTSSCASGRKHPGAIQQLEQKTERCFTSFLHFQRQHLVGTGTTEDSQRRWRFRHGPPSARNENPEKAIREDPTTNMPFMDILKISNINGLDIIHDHWSTRI